MVQKKGHGDGHCIRRVAVQKKMDGVAHIENRVIATSSTEVGKLFVVAKLHGRFIAEFTIQHFLQARWVSVVELLRVLNLDID